MPIKWKESRVVPIPKVQAPKSPDNYDTISLLNEEAEYKRGVPGQKMADRKRIAARFKCVTVSGKTRHIANFITF